MGKGKHLSEFEHLVLLALVRLGGTGYGMPIRRELEESSGRTTSIGAVYATLERLQAKGHLESWHADPQPTRGGRRRRYFRLTATGTAALRSSWETLSRMWAGVSLDPEST